MMRRSLSSLLFALAAALPAVPLHAKVCALDNPPAATLLLPYFEVDTGSATGVTTLFAIGNAGAAATLAHVILWTDAAVPTLAFDVYLTGYDVQTINLRDVFAGRLPSTADAAHDQQDRISPRGEFSQDSVVAGCDGLLPPPPLPAQAVDALVRAHTGLASANNPAQCSGLAYNDGVARGYVTVDVARRCSVKVPGDAGYFGADGVAADSNVLWGDFYYVTPGTVATAQGQNLVRLESAPATFAGKPTFYGRYDGASGADGREPLSTTWAARFLAGGPFDATTDLILWRDARRAGAPFACSGKPAWFPLDQRTVFVFDEEENAYQLGVCNLPILCPLIPPLFPQAVARVRVGTDLPVPVTFGWLFLDLNGAIDTAPSWVGTVASARSQFSVGLAGTPLDDPCAPHPGALDPGSF